MGKGVRKSGKRPSDYEHVSKVSGTLAANIGGVMLEEKGRREVGMASNSTHHLFYSILFCFLPHFLAVAHPSSP